MANSYMVGRGPLTVEEGLVLTLAKTFQKPIGEHELHTVIKISQDASGYAFYSFEDFEPFMWRDVDDRYLTGPDSTPYSVRLHGIIDSLVRKHYLVRDNENPIIISIDDQLILF